MDINNGKAGGQGNGKSSPVPRRSTGMQWRHLSPKRFHPRQVPQTRGSPVQARHGEIPRSADAARFPPCSAMVKCGGLTRGEEAFHNLFFSNARTRTFLMEPCRRVPCHFHRSIRISDETASINVPRPKRRMRCRDDPKRRRVPFC
jgi:hypothetical protein